MQRCFDLSRSIDLHVESVMFTEERAVSGTRSGLIGFGQRVEWRAKHFGVWFSMQVEIIAFDPPRYFQDAMVNGPFRSFKHDHFFEEHNASTLMIDRLSFASPGWILGRLVDATLLRSYLRRFLSCRNAILKTVAESDQWPRYLSFPAS
jgi:ligand-binding SRPBCC domain-containing protein